MGPSSSVVTSSKQQDPGIMAQGNDPALETMGMGRLPVLHSELSLRVAAHLRGQIPGFIAKCLVFPPELNSAYPVIHLQPKTSISDRRLDPLKAHIVSTVAALSDVKFQIHRPEENIDDLLNPSGPLRPLIVEPNALTNVPKLVLSRSTSSNHTTSTRQQVKGCTLSNEYLFRRARQTLPVEIELLKSWRYRLKLSNGPLDLLVLQASVPEHKEPALKRWREKFEEDNFITVIVDRTAGDSIIKNQIGRHVPGRNLLTAKDLPQVKKVLPRYFRTPPELPKVDVFTVGLEDMTNLEMVAIDAPYVLNREDLLWAGPGKEPGNIRLVAAIIDVTSFVYPGTRTWTYSKRVGVSLYGSRSVIHTLGEAIANGPASFLTGEVRPAWVVDMQINSNGEIVEETYHHAAVKSHAHIFPEQFSSMLNASATPPFNLRYLQEAGARLHSGKESTGKLFRLTGDAYSGVVLGACMSTVKARVASFLQKRGFVLPFKNHTLPTPERQAELAEAVRRLKIPATPGDFDIDSSFAGIIEALENRNNQPEARQLLKEILDVYLIRTRLDTINRGHHAIGAEAYVELKPRFFEGILTQLALRDALEKQNRRPPNSEYEACVMRRNRQNKRRGEIEYMYRFIEKLEDNLSLCGQTLPVTVQEVGDDYVLIDPGNPFTKWGFVELNDVDKARGLQAGQLYHARLQGFNMDKMRFQFALIDQAAEA